MNKYLTGRLPELDIKPSGYVPLSVRMRRLTPAEERVMMVRMRSDRGTDKKGAKDIAADPHNPQPALHFYETYQSEGSAPPEPVLIALKQAFLQAPYDHHLRTVVANQLVLENKGDLAASMLGPLTFAPHPSKELRRIRDAVDAIKAGKMADARAKLAEALKKEAEDED